MVFSSAPFLFFFLPAVWLLCRLIPGLRGKNLLLIAASLLFYTAGQAVYLPLLLLCVLSSYFFGRLLMREGTHRKIIAAIAVCTSLAILAIFKYLDFAIASINSLLGLTLPQLGLVLPVGISFYTFHSLSYILDVYRVPAKGTRSFSKMLLYISFFPQLVAGPIIKYHDVADQIDRRNTTPENVVSGIARFIRGLSKKLLLANTAGAAADQIFSLEPSMLNLPIAWLGAVCYTLQIFFDFSGYSDMALGLAKMFGFTFQENFDRPYTSASLREFWRRWHISLSSWFRDYLYIPLGGNRKGVWYTRLNLLLVFFCTGLWHGANWTFVLWGLWHGLFLILETGEHFPLRRERVGILAHIYTMLVVILGFVLFRAESLSAAWQMFIPMFTGFAFIPEHSLLLRQLLTPVTATVLIVSMLLALHVPQRLLQRLRGTRIFQVCGTFGTAALFLLDGLNLAASTYNPFIYFQF